MPDPMPYVYRAAIAFGLGGLASIVPAAAGSLYWTTVCIGSGILAALFQGLAFLFRRAYPKTE